MRVFADITMLIITTIIALRSFNLITRYKSDSLSDFAILLLYIFQCLPVFFDLTIGIPQYELEAFDEFKKALTNDAVCIIYDVYMILFFSALYLVSKNKQKYNPLQLSKTSESGFKIPEFLLWIITASPIIHVFLSGNISLFLVYTTSAGRGLDAGFTQLNSNLILLGTISSIMLYFRKKSGFLSTLLLIAYAFALVWINGKRYMVVTYAYCFLYMYILIRGQNKFKLNLKVVTIFGVVFVMFYCVYYITNVKITADDSFESIYSALRVDFGRDDVVKFTIMRELIEKKPILDYRGQTVISTLFMIVPRSIFPTKPFPHYRYLTAALYGLDISDIPSGMTPSILEMMIANFGVWGIGVCILFLCWFCNRADKAATHYQKLLYSMVLMGLVSQSLDAMMVIFYMLVLVMANDAFCAFTGKRLVLTK